MHLGPIGGYIIRIGGYSAPLKQHRKSSEVTLDFSSLDIIVQLMKF